MEIRSAIVMLLFIACARCFLNETVKERVLSRKKRFLLFPEGSSFQLVYCVQASALIPIGDIFLFGSTAALAWNLPTDTKLLDMLREQARVPQRRGDQEQEKNIYYLDEQGKVIAKVPYKRKHLINPVFAKRSVDQLSYREKLKLKIDRTKMHEKKLNEDFLKKTQMDQNSIEFHRDSRLSLFEKLETFFSALGQDGRQCVLHKLCKAGQPYRRQGTFLQETLRVIFTLGQDGRQCVLHKLCKARQPYRRQGTALQETLRVIFALGQDGRQCVLHKLCKARQPYRRQGTALQETLRVIFALPKGSVEEEYDKAHTAKECDLLYPGCEYLQDPLSF